MQGNRERHRWILRAQSILQSVWASEPPQLSVSLNRPGHPALHFSQVETQDFNFALTRSVKMIAPSRGIDNPSRRFLRGTLSLANFAANAFAMSVLEELNGHNGYRLNVAHA